MNARSRGRLIPPKVRDDQTRASNPERSVFVSANAGSGKTHVLVNRVIRLLLAGTPPEKILCITYTKAAAANMAQRVFERLSAWIALDDAALDAAMTDIGVTAPTATLRNRARRLFATALETPGGLKVQTIHALCTRLLQQFPFEADVAAGFAVVEERERDVLMDRARLAVLLEGATKPQSDIGRALTTVMSYAADTTFQDVVRDACLDRHGIVPRDGRAGVARVMRDLSAALGLRPDETAESVAGALVDGPHMPRARWPSIAQALQTGSKTDQSLAATLRAALAASGLAQTLRYLELFWLASDSTTLRDRMMTAKCAKAHPDIATILNAERDRVGPLTDKWRAVRLRERTGALMTIASDVTARYGKEKLARGLLDYEDLIDKTLDLLRATNISWVHYKLDQGIDHVLIDEAQDTSPKQWQIVAQLISEFTSGEGARSPVRRTVFAVGDEKQSIFSFQGADPRQFAHWRKTLAKAFGGAQAGFDAVKFDLSFRSGATILAGVDSVFKRPEIHASIQSETEGAPVHQALADAAPSYVELWEPEVPDKRPDPVGWRAPYDAVSETSAPVRLARRVADGIRKLTAGAEWTGRVNGTATRRPIRPQDILVLVRKRGPLFDALIQALKRGGIPVAGADRLTLTAHIAVADLMALADAVLTPDDDLSLAVALKSPLFGLGADDPGESALFALAHGREGSLRAALERKAATDAPFDAMLERLRRYETMASAFNPHNFYTRVLGADGGRARFLARLGNEANDALDEFLEAALVYERSEPATLQGFMGWLRAAETEVKRDLEMGRDEVRVMTVHGAKGLEAPVVFLPDTMSPPAGRQGARLIQLPQAAAGDQLPPLAVWAGSKEDDCAAVATARAAMTKEASHESRRLLYVAMTRAAERLVVGGYLDRNVTEPNAGTWYAMIRDGLENSGLRREDVAPGIVHFRREDDPWPAQESAGGPAIETPPETATGAPAWLWRAAPSSPRGRKILHPSEVAADQETDALAAMTPRARHEARQRGLLVHRLLQSLPDLAIPHRRAAALAFLERNAAEWPAAARSALCEQVLSLIDDQRFAVIFGPGSRAEIPIAGRLTDANGNSIDVSGQIDRMVRTGDEAVIIDFKTGRPSPHASQAGAYVAQLALYRALLMKISPGRQVRAALLWTELPEITEIFSSALDAELARIMAGARALDHAESDTYVWATFPRDS
jgi:ATP-dependent helicase/nuclease subunit A